MCAVLNLGNTVSKKVKNLLPPNNPRNPSCLPSEFTLPAPTSSINRAAGIYRQRSANGSVQIEPHVPPLFAVCCGRMQGMFSRENAAIFAVSL